MAGLWAAAVPIPSSNRSLHVSDQSVLLHLVGRRSVAGRLQAVRVWAGHSAIHRAAPARLRARVHQAGRAGREGEARGGEDQSRAVPAEEVVAALLQHLPLDLKRLMGDQDHIGENLASDIEAHLPAVA